MTLALHVEADEEFFDQEPVIEDDRGDRGHLLIGQVWVLDAGQAGLVAVSENVAEFATCGLHPARDDQGGIAEIDDPYFAAVFDAPPMAKLGWQIGLAAVGHLGSRRTGHTCIVLEAKRQGVALGINRPQNPLPKCGHAQLEAMNAHHSGERYTLQVNAYPSRSSAAPSVRGLGYRGGCARE